MGGFSGIVKTMTGALNDIFGGGGGGSSSSSAGAPAAAAAASKAAPDLRGTDKNMADTQSFQDAAAMRKRSSGAAVLSNGLGSTSTTGTKSLLGS